jgi:hypothetical protein
MRSLPAEVRMPPDGQPAVLILRLEERKLVSQWVGARSSKNYRYKWTVRVVDLKGSRGEKYLETPYEDRHSPPSGFYEEANAFALEALKESSVGGVQSGETGGGAEPE